MALKRAEVWITTDVSPVVCRCGSVCLRGVAEGITVMVDPWPVRPADRVTEAIALLDGRWVFTMVGRSLYRREGTGPNGHVMIQHRCGLPLTVAVAPPSNLDDPDIPPF